MKLVTVIPFSRGVFKDTLTYWSGKSVSPGSLVTVPLRNKSVSALAVSVEDLGEVKAEVKKAPFALKKIISVRRGVFFREFAEAARRSADYFAAPVGSILEAFVPKAVLEAEFEGVKEKPISGLEQSESFSAPRLKIEKLVFQAEKEERFAAYRSLVREEFARGASVFICFPKIESVLAAAASFEKGIEEYAVVFHGDMKRKEMLGEWSRAVKEPHPVVILGTPTFLSVPREDLKTVIVEEENSRAYKTIGRPELDARYFIERYAEERGLKFIAGDAFLRTETLYRYHEQEFMPFTSVKFRALSPAGGSVIDMKKYISGDGKTPPFLSNELKTLVELTLRERGRVVILTGRRGLHQATICGDCGALVSCSRCGAPLVIHEKKSGRVFVCHKCGEEKSIEADGEEKCAKCGSWRLKALGLGSEGAAKEIAAQFPGVKVLRLDGDAAKTDKAAKKIVGQFYETGGGILIGTEMMLNYLTERVETSAILNADSFFTVPDWRINEKIFSLILSLRSITEKAVMVQTQENEREIFEQALRGDLMSFYRSEIDERRKFGYPPFAELVKISWNARKENAEKETAHLLDKLSGWNARPYFSRTETPKGIVRANVLIKLPRGAWPEKKLLAAIKTLSPKFVISVDPESIV